MIKEKIKHGMVLIKCDSHRARDKVYGTLNRKPQSYWSMHRDTAKGFLAITPEELITINEKSIKGVKQTYWTDDLMQCWDWGKS